MTLLTFKLRYQVYDNGRKNAVEGVAYRTRRYSRGCDYSSESQLRESKVSHDFELLCVALGDFCRRTERPCEVIDDKKILDLGKQLLGVQYCDARDGVVAAVQLLESNGAELTDLQKEVVMFAVEVGCRIDQDSFDHEAVARPELGVAGRRVFALLKRFLRR